MITIQQDSKIKSFKLTNSHKILPTSPQSLVNSENYDLVLVEMSLLGMDHVYSLLPTFKSRTYFNEELCSIENREATIQISRVIGDSPVADKINIFSNTISTKDISLENWISLYQMECIFEGMNTISAMELDSDISYQIDTDICDISSIDFKCDIKYKYIVLYANDTYEFANSFYWDKCKGVFVYIPEFNCWQYVSKKKWNNLNHSTGIELREAIVTSHLSCSEITHQQEYYASNIFDLIKYSIYIIVDLRMREIFMNSPEYFYLEREQKAALDVTISIGDEKITALFTFEELYSHIHKFSILKLINNLICLKP